MEVNLTSAMFGSVKTLTTWECKVSLVLAFQSDDPEEAVEFYLVNTASE